MFVPIEKKGCYCVKTIDLYNNFKDDSERKKLQKIAEELKMIYNFPPYNKSKFII